jgi:hypothetical protein
MVNGVQQLNPRKFYEGLKGTGKYYGAFAALNVTTEWIFDEPYYGTVSSATISTVGGPELSLAQGFANTVKNMQDQLQYYTPAQQKDKTAQYVNRLIDLVGYGAAPAALGLLEGYKNYMEIQDDVKGYKRLDAIERLWKNELEVQFGKDYVEWVDRSIKQNVFHFAGGVEADAWSEMEQKMNDQAFEMEHGKLIGFIWKTAYENRMR